jgi:hypothetical protein
MNTTTLLVGQHVHMESGVYSCEGKVIKVTPDGVDVLIPRRLSLEREEILRFDKDGKGKEGRGVDNNATHECGPWYIIRTTSERPSLTAEKLKARFERLIKTDFGS